MKQNLLKNKSDLVIKFNIELVSIKSNFYSPQSSIYLHLFWHEFFGNSSEFFFVIDKLKSKYGVEKPEY